MPTNWKTTVAGVGVGATIVATAAHMYIIGMWDFDALAKTIIGALTAFGFIAAKDAK